MSSVRDLLYQLFQYKPVKKEEHDDWVILEKKEKHPVTTISFSNKEEKQISNDSSHNADTDNKNEDKLPHELVDNPVNTKEDINEIVQSILNELIEDLEKKTFNVNNEPKKEDSSITQEEARVENSTAVSEKHTSSKNYLENYLEYGKWMGAAATAIGIGLFAFRLYKRTTLDTHDKQNSQGVTSDLCSSEVSDTRNFKS